MAVLLGFDDFRFADGDEDRLQIQVRNLGRETATRYAAPCWWTARSRS